MPWSAHQRVDQLDDVMPIPVGNTNEEVDDDVDRDLLQGFPQNVLDEWQEPRLDIADNSAEVRNHGFGAGPMACP